MRNVTKHPALVAQECVDRLNKTPLFIDFLRCAAYVFQNGLEESTILQWWTNNNKRLKSSNPEVEFSLFLKDVVIINDPRLPTKTETSDKPDSISSELLRAIKLASKQEIEDRKTAQQGELSKYWAFKPAWSFHTVLPKVFPEKDPAVVIASYLRQIFPSLHGHVLNEQATPKNTVRLIRGSKAHRLMIEVSRWVTSQISGAVGNLFEYVLQHRQEMTWDGSTEAFLKAATSHSHALFEVVMEAWQFNLVGPELTKGEELITLLHLPFSKNPDMAGTPHFTPNNLDILTCDHARDVTYGDGWEACQEAGQRAWNSFFKRYKDFRINDLDGQSPVDIGTADDLRYSVENLYWNLGGDKD